MSHSLLTISTEKPKTWKELFKINLGRAFSVVCRQRATHLSNSPTSYPAGIKDKMLMAFLKEHARVANNTDFFDRLHENFWQGQGGEVFSSNCDHRFEDLFLARQAEDFRMLQKYWNQGSYRHIVEIGCCAGLHLQYLTNNLPGVESAVGIDINPVQIQTNNENPEFDSRIKFFATDGGQWIIDNAQPNSLFVTNGGVFEYFSQSRLNELVRHIASNLGPAILFTVEPVADDFSKSNSTESVPFGEELSFCHNYRHLYESNGLNVLHQRPFEFESWRMTTTIASCSTGL